VQKTKHTPPTPKPQTKKKGKESIPAVLFLLSRRGSDGERIRKGGGGRGGGRGKERKDREKLITCAYDLHFLVPCRLGEDPRKRRRVEGGLGEEDPHFSLLLLCHAK